MRPSVGCQIFDVIANRPSGSASIRDTATESCLSAMSTTTTNGLAGSDVHVPLHWPHACGWSLSQDSSAMSTHLLAKYRIHSCGAYSGVPHVLTRSSTFHS